MNTLTYYKFLESLSFVKHYQAPYTADAHLTEQPPLREMPEGFTEALLNEVSSNSIHPIIISRDFVKKHELVGELYTEKFSHYLDKQNTPFEIPMPFDSIWIEFLPEVGKITPMLGAGFTQYGKGKVPQIMGYLVQKIILDSGPAYSITAFIFVTNDDGSLDDVCLMSDILPRGEYQKMHMGGAGFITMHGMIWHNQVFDILNLMSQERQVGIDKTKTQVRIGKGSQRRLVKIKNIVYVVPSSEKSAFNQKHGTSVDWSHRWEVRGHWRRVAHIGKDPEGNYCIPGFTWVLPSVKGPEKAPLIGKTRYALPSKKLEDILNNSAAESTT